MIRTHSVHGHDCQGMSKVRKGYSGEDRRVAFLLSEEGSSVTRAFPMQAWWYMSTVHSLVGSQAGW